MNFSILDTWGDYPPNAKNHVFLIWDNWNDYSYFTLFAIFYVDKHSEKHDLGAIKIGFKGQETGDRIYQIGHRFSNIGDIYFSVGTSAEYYEGLKSLGPQLRDDILMSLNDIAKNNKLYKEIENEPVFQTSFLRSLNSNTITGQFHRIAEGGAKLTPFNFSYAEGADDDEKFGLSFEIKPESFPPTNVHVLIGKNGVGKTVLINKMIDSLVVDQERKDEVGRFFFYDAEPWEEEVGHFANLISVSFSAFDEIEPRSENVELIDEMTYSYIGLKLPSSNDTNAPKIKDSTMLPKEFLSSLASCRSAGTYERWTSAITTLQSDPYFNEVRIIDLIEMDGTRESSAKTLRTFRRLSSGHKIVLLTITRLIEKLQERSLVIMDEPEAHLHPPLLSAFIRAVSDLLIATNGVAIVATHSPVILQEVPKSCAWKLKRSGNLMGADRLPRETFGENVGLLTNDVFGLEVTDSGFYTLLNRILLERNYDYDSVIETFNGQLGTEARSIIMAIISNR
ncbi:ATP-binding protein [Sphingobacterium sp. lm-10]|uniref:AAA family ATPase n=1 Tax=Sphingobacterium sp. lm-10 TaxID=2944904 RepID=UPI002020217E|nr:AAA family ATPase [Sphingobacterium sp. lm-10]MCL7987065.1 ATP-binding protein [Sphingobacterium sp. lm-10]